MRRFRVRTKWVSRPGAAGLSAHVDAVVNGQAGFQGGFLFGGVYLEVAVEAEVAEDGDAQIGVTVNCGTKAVGVHVP